MRIFEIDDNDPASLIHRYCYDSLRGPKLYRGVNKLPNIINDIRTDRRPRDSSNFEVFVFDTLMELLGWPFRKSNTLSVANDESLARAFGKLVFTVYPFNSSQYMFSEKYADMMSITDNIIEQYYDHFGYKDTTKILDGSNAKALIREYLEASYNIAGKSNYNIIADFCKLKMTSNPKDLSKSAGEILVFGEKYVANIKKSISEEESETLELPDLEVGDELLVGKFKNKKATISGFKTDQHNQPVATTDKGDQKIFKGRVSKLMNNDE